MESLTQLDTPSSITAYAETRIGGRSENQDSIGWQATPFGYLVTVCDGMGGGPGGKTAVQTVAFRTSAGENVLRSVRRGNAAYEHAARSGRGGHPEVPAGAWRAA